MAGNVSGLHVFANDVGPVPLALLDQNYDALVTALNTLSTFSNFYADTGTTNQLNVTAAQHQLVSYTDGLQITVRVAATNTGAATLNVAGLGAQPILTPIGSELEPNALLAGSMVTLIYNAARQAWQLASGADAGQITVPLRVTNSDGQAALSINVDGSGYLGDFNGNGLSWDGACNFNFDGGATLSGVNAPFSVSSTPGGQQIFTVNNPVEGSGTPLVTITPGSGAGDVQSGPTLLLDGQDNYPVLVIDGATHTQPDVPVAVFNASCGAPGNSNGIFVTAGTNASDKALLLTNCAGAVIGSVNGDGSWALGPAPNQLVMSASGAISTTGTATLPMPPLIDLPGINITNPQNGEALVYDSATNSWVNGAPVNALATLNDVALATPLGGQTLVYNSTTQRWVNSTPVTMLQQLNDVHAIGAVPGQVLTYSISPQPGWVNATIPGYNFLSNLGVGPNPQAGWVLTWDGQAWVGAEPGQVAAFPLSSLTDVGITTPLNRQVLTYDAPNAKWINAPAPSPSLATLPDVALTSQAQGQVLAWDNTLHRWINSSLPGGSVIALDTLMDTNISDPQNNQVLTWDYASSRWENRSPAILPVITSPQAGQMLSYNGTNWVNTTLTPAALASLSDVALATPTNGQMLVYNSGTSKWGNSNTLTASSNQIALNLKGAAGQVAFTAESQIGSVAVFNSTVANGGYVTWQNNGTSIGDLGAALGTLGVGTATDMVMAARSGGLYLATNNVVRESINSTGNVTVNTPSSGVPLTVNGKLQISGSSAANNAEIGIQNTDANGGNWRIGDGVQLSAGALVIYDALRAAVPFAISSTGNVTVNAPSTGATVTVNGIGNNNLNLQTPSGASPILSWSQAGRTQWQALNDGGTDTWRLWNQNSGTVLSANNTGNVVINVPLVNTGPGLIVYGGPNTGAYGEYVARFFARSAAGIRHGVYIEAGGTNTDTALGVNTTAGTTLLSVGGDGAIYCTPRPSSASNDYQCYTRNSNEIVRATSSGRYKRDMRSLQRALAKEVISRLRPVSYRSSVEYDDQTQLCYGLIAEEVEVVDPRLVVHDAEGRPDAVRYQAVNMMLLSLVQELLGMDEPEQTYG